MSDLSRSFEVPGLDASSVGEARQRWATRAKPPGSLGRLEELGVQLAGVVGRCPPAVPSRPGVLVFAGDHGVVASGASAWPSEVTGFMAATMAAEQAAISCIAETVGATVTVVDVGVASDTSQMPGVVQHKVRPGTADLSVGPAMTIDQAWAALDVGRSVAAQAIANGTDLVIAGDMGIGNTTPSACIVAWATRADPAYLTGPGAGLPVDQMNSKIALVEAALRRVHANGADGIGLLAEIGGMEILAIAGAYIAAAQQRVPFIVDGVIACAALVAAELLAPGLASMAVAGHLSSEPAAAAALDHLGLVPLIDLDLRLGEGTGACLAVPIVRAAAACLSGMADLPDL